MTVLDCSCSHFTFRSPSDFNRTKPPRKLARYLTILVKSLIINIVSPIPALLSAFDPPLSFSIVPLSSFLFVLTITQTFLLRNAPMTLCLVSFFFSSFFACCLLMIRFFTRLLPFSSTRAYRSCLVVQLGGVGSKSCASEVLEIQVERTRERHSNLMSPHVVSIDG